MKQRANKKSAIEDDAEWENILHGIIEKYACNKTRYALKPECAGKRVLFGGNIYHYFAMAYVLSFFELGE
jgi:hypothetical protein